jgi:hypothetical protein
MTRNWIEEFLDLRKKDEVQVLSLHWMSGAASVTVVFSANDIITGDADRLDSACEQAVTKFNQRTVNAPTGSRLPATGDNA